MKNLLLYVVFFLLISCEGDVGPEGLNSLMKTSQESSGANCANGGLKVETGLDRNRDEVLGSDEVQKVDYICNGARGDDGQISLVNSIVEANGDNCPAGGMRLEIGIDTNDDGTLNESEIRQIRYICDGQTGPFDRKIQLLIFSAGSGMSGFASGVSRGNLPFNITDYDKVDSVVYVVHAKSTTNSNTPYSNGEGFELVDTNDDSPIEGGRIVIPVTMEMFSHLRSEKLTFPERDMILGLRGVTSNPNLGLNILDNVYLVIYRSE